MTVPMIVDRLFREHRHPEGREYYYREVADVINTRYLELLGGVPIDPTHLSKIRAGDIRDPGRRFILVLCAFFEVPVTTFFPELAAESPEDATAVIRVRGLSPHARRHLEALIQDLQRTAAASNSDESDPPDPTPT